MPIDPDCLFCKIIAGDLPSEILHTDERAVAFRDINPQAPTHVLVVPREHLPDAAATAGADPALMGHLVSVAQQVAGQEGVSSYRLVFNTGTDAGQDVFHTHLHLLGGRRFGWPPG